MKTPPDITWTEIGAFTMFMPETAPGREAWREMAKESEGTGKFLNHQRQGIIRQLRAAGYTVRKAKPPTVSPADISELLNKHTA